MFERRLRAFLLIVFLVGAVLIARAVQVQIVEGSHWRSLAAESLKRSELLNTTRGRILDFKGEVIAHDKPCIDVCVDYRALTDPPDRAWVRDTAIRRLRAGNDAYRTTDAAGRRRLIEAEIEQVHADLENMWNRLAELGRRPRSEIDEIRRQTVERVEYRRKFIVARRYERALEQHEQKDPDPWYRKWLDERSGQVPQVEQFDIMLSEQTAPHVILHNVDNPVQVELERDLAKYPGLSVRAGMKRYYPYGEVASHVIGRLSKVMREDLIADANFADELRQYLPNDLVGRTGLEAMNEQRLRGTRGRTERDVVTGNILSQTVAVPGNDIRTTIDIELQSDIEQAFKNVKLAYGDRQQSFIPMPGAAVVIDIPTGEVRALVSYPNYDLNEFDRLYNRLVRDELNRPLMNRATQFALEPGSTVKPLVGLTAISIGEFGPHDTIECTGYLVLDGRRYSYGRCWTMNIFNQTHQFGAAPHPNGFLSYTDAVERSCNVFFETLADRMGLEALVEGYRQFGLGQRTGIGIPEVPGLLPDGSAGPARQRRSMAWFASIGQDQIATTPLQIANAIATIARSGVWMRPTLVPISDPQPPIPDGDTRGRRVDLRLNAAALDAAVEGMIRVVNSPAGTGTSIRRGDVLIAGKTGSAQASPLTVADRDRNGNLIRNDRGGIQRTRVPAGTSLRSNPDIPWYRYTGKNEDELTHAWYVGFFPAHEPKIAFAVFVEYGGSGGNAAGSVANAIVDACIEKGYVRP